MNVKVHGKKILAEVIFEKELSECLCCQIQISVSVGLLPSSYLDTFSEQIYFLFPIKTIGTATIKLFSCVTDSSRDAPAVCSEVSLPSYRPLPAHLFPVPALRSGCVLVAPPELLLAGLTGLDQHPLFSQMLNAGMLKGLTLGCLPNLFLGDPTYFHSSEYRVYSDISKIS